MLARDLTPVLIATAVETTYALADGSYWAVPEPEDGLWHEFPVYHDPAGGFGGGYGGEG